MTRDEVKKKVFDVIYRQFGTYEVSELTNIYDDLDADSLDYIGLLMDLEDEFEIQLNEDEFNELNSVDEIIDFIYDTTL